MKLAKEQKKKIDRYSLFYFKHQVREALIMDGWDDEGSNVLTILSHYVEKYPNDMEKLNNEFDYVLNNYKPV